MSRAELRQWQSQPGIRMGMLSLREVDAAYFGFRDVMSAM